MDFVLDDFSQLEANLSVLNVFKARARNDVQSVRCIKNIFNLTLFSTYNVYWVYWTVTPSQVKEDLYIERDLFPISKEHDFPTCQCIP